MRQNFNQPAFLYEATRVYLELGSARAAGPRPDQGVDASTTGRPRGAVRRSTRTRACGWNSIWRRCWTSVCRRCRWTAALVEDARRTFSRVSLADRVYGAIRRSPQAAALAPWRPGDAAGASGVRVFRRRSGLPMTDGVPGFFTVDGFYKVLLPQLPAATRQAASESWVLGRQAEIDPNQSAGAEPAERRDRRFTPRTTSGPGTACSATSMSSRWEHAAGGAEPVYPVVTAVAAARPAGRDRAPAYADHCAAA